MMRVAVLPRPVSAVNPVLPRSVRLCLFGCCRMTKKYLMERKDNHSLHTNEQLPLMTPLYAEFPANSAIEI